MTDEELVATFDSQAPSSVRTRRSELVNLGLVRDSGRRVPSVRGRDQIVWEVSDGS